MSGTEFPQWSPGGAYRINSLTEFNPLVLSDIRAFLEQDPPRIPIKQITGFTGFTAYSSYVNTDQTASSTTYGSLGGPLLEKLPPGQYLLTYGALARGTPAAGFGGSFSPSLNGDTPASGSECVIFLTNPDPATISGAMSSVARLESDGGNTIELLYLTNSAGNGIAYRNRWLTALRYG